MATETLSSSFDLPPNFDYTKEPETGRLYYIDHTTETTSWIYLRLKDELPPNFEYRIDKASGKIYFIDHANKTSSLSHPCHKDFHWRTDTEPELLYPYKQCLDAEGRQYYINDESKTTSWMHPTKLAELKAIGILDEEIHEYRGRIYRHGRHRF
jgi:hypothetical protein